MRVAGVDEAGRGPILGPLVMAAVVISSDDELPRGVSDSKKLTPQKREELYEQLITLKHAVRIVEPPEIDAAVANNNLNWLEAEHTASLVNQLQPQQAIIDCPSRNLQAYAEFLRERCPEVTIHAQFKADQEHPVVAAASIIAKVTRDRLVEALAKKAGFDFGSGYLTDPKTQAFLNDHFDKSFVGWRKSWKPYKRRVAQDSQQRLL